MSESNPPTITEMTWYEITKIYQGGRSTWQIAVPKGIKLSKGEWDTLLEWIGENTNGGHNYGYSVKTRRLRQKSTTLKVLRYPSGLCHQLVGLGTVVTSSQRMI